MSCFWSHKYEIIESYTGQYFDTLNGVKISEAKSGVYIIKKCKKCGSESGYLESYNGTTSNVSVEYIRKYIKNK